MSSKRTVKTLSLGDKVKIIDEIDSKVCKKMDVARKYGIPSSTLSTIYKNRERIMKFSRAGAEPTRKRMKAGKFPQLEEEVWKWILSISGHNSTVSGTTIRKRAQWLAERQDYPGFHASVGWLEKFRARHNLKTIRKKIVLPTGVNPMSDSIGNEEFILPDVSPEGDVLQESTYFYPPIRGTEIKQEPYEYDWNSSTGDPSPNSAPVLSTDLQRQSGLSSKDTSREMIVRPSSNGASENRPAKEPSESEPSMSSEALVNNEGFVLLDDSVEVDVLQVSTSLDRPIRDTKMKQELDWKLSTIDPGPNSAPVLSNCSTSHQTAKKHSETEKIFHQPFKNQPTKEPTEEGHSELVPMSVMTSEGLTPRSKSDCTSSPDGSSAGNHSDMSERNNGKLSLDNSPGQDQLVCFGNYVVSKLKQMDTRTCLFVQKAITDIIFGAEIRKLETVAIDYKQSSL